MEAIESFSEDKSCPNSRFDLYVNNESYSNCVRQKWNSVANKDNNRIDNSFMFNDWPFPIFLIKNEHNITELQDVSLYSKLTTALFALIKDYNNNLLIICHWAQCFDNHSKDWPLCAVELTAETYAAKDAKTCIRRTHMRNSPINLIQPSRRIFTALF